MTLYGLLGYTHGWNKLVTVMSPEGDSVVRAAITTAADDFWVVTGEGLLTQYHAKRRGVLQRLIADHHIIIINKPAWDTKKTELGDAVLD
jgi:hypothetical protein